MEKWNDEPLNYSNLSIFGALAFTHIKKDKIETQVEMYLNWLSRGCERLQAVKVESKRVKMLYKKGCHI
uniref:Uncharacterized protein n=1 Tax=Cajanus cajan TaxID=3821 RepID=A0A151SXM7_CAJCA|nr:hypothetical protein KK1_014983 [Cajanus cajan]